MNLELNETQILLRDSLRELLAKEVPFDQVRACEKERRADAALWAKLIQLGWLATPFPAELGGGDGGMLEAGIVVEELARRAAVVPVVETLACGLALLRRGSGSGAREQVRRIASGEQRVVPAVLEANDDFERLACTASADGRLHGEKYFVDYAEFASHHLVAALRGGALGLYLVEASDPAVKIERRDAIGRTPQSQVRYDGARAEALGGQDACAELVRIARALTAVQIVSCMQVSLEQTVKYTSIREQFGRPIGTFQAVQHHAANMAIELESCRFLAYEALDALARDTATDEQIAIAKAAASRAVPELTMLGHQLHGGQGYIEENDLYFFTLRGKDRSLAWGSVEECLDVVSRSVDQLQDWL
jgi:alkylation response protein AidB-like acyl-CoA dehydrogenase